MSNLEGIVRAVVFDWAGTIVDFGSRAPVGAFVELFRRHGIDISEPEARGPMGVAKRTHIAELLALPRIAGEWHSRHGEAPDEPTIDRLYGEFIKLQSAILTQYADVIPGVLQTIEELRGAGIGIGSTTGYSRPMMDLLEPAAKANGLSLDVVLTVDDVPRGRPAPWMALAAVQRMGVYPIRTCVKVGDTAVDMAEGLNAGMWTVGVTETGNEVGLSEQELNAMPADQRVHAARQAEERLRKAGAHYVIPGVGHLIPVVAEINERIARGEHP